MRRPRSLNLRPREREGESHCNFVCHAGPAREGPRAERDSKSHGERSGEAGSKLQEDCRARPDAAAAGWLGLRPVLQRATAEWPRFADARARGNRDSVRGATLSTGQMEPQWLTMRQANSNLERAKLVVDRKGLSVAFCLGQNSGPKFQ